MRRPTSGTERLEYNARNALFATERVRTVDIQC